MRLLRVFVFAAAFTLFAGNAVAQVQHYDLMLGQRQIGTLQFDPTTMEMLSNIDNTPLGLGIGRFQARSTSTISPEGRVKTSYLSEGSKRRIAVDIADGQVITTTIDPASEATPLSDPPAVPQGVIPLTEGFAQIATHGGCPEPMMIYDGRRVVSLQTLVQSDDTTGLSCEIAYQVIKGPGHVSPFRFTQLGLKLFYQHGQLRQMTVSAGGFVLQVLRK